MAKIPIPVMTTAALALGGCRDELLRRAGSTGVWVS